MIRYITKILSVSQGVVGADHRSFLDVVDLPALAAAMAGLRTALADGAATNPVLGVEEDHALIAVIFTFQSKVGDLVCRHFRKVKNFCVATSRSRLRVVTEAGRSAFGLLN